MNPFFFGAAERRLFGIYTPARAPAANARAVVLCHPWGQEYLGAHRSIRALGSMLSAAGIHVLRFDYYGTGDSGADMRQADLEGWKADIGMAIDELRDTTDAARVSLVGLRVGASLAAEVAARRPKEVDSLVLWDPIVSGSAYVRELGREALALGDGEREIGGFPLTHRMTAELAAIDLASEAAPVNARTLVIVSEEGEGHAALGPALKKRFKGVLEAEQIAAAPAWVEDVSFQTGAVPIKVLQRIVEWFK